MRIHLPEEWIEYLSTQPEAGMGYQKVDVLFDSGDTLRDALVFNCEELQLPDSDKNYAKQRIVSLQISR
jgi:hypothetical protein